VTKKKVLIACAILGYLALSFVVVQYLAGVLYFLANKTLPHDVALGTWAKYWHFYSVDPIQRKRLQFAMAFALIVMLGIPLLILNAVFQKRRSLHGDARFATPGEIRKKGYMRNEGVIVGKQGSQYLMQGGQSPILIAAPTRQGKGAGVVIPNLLNWPESVVALDIKMENFQITSLFRQRHGQNVLLWNPFAEDGRTHRWNPMDSIRRDRDLRVVDVISIGEQFYPRTGDESGMWNDLARDLYSGLVLYLLETPSLPCTFGEVLRQVSGKGQGIKEHVQQIMRERHTGAAALSDACYQAFSRFCSAQERTLSSIVTTMTAPLLIFQNTYVDAATSATDFDVSRVRKERMTIYVGIPGDMMATAAPIVNLFFSHLIRQNMKELPEQNPELKYKCLVLMDEFTTLGRVGIIPKTIGQIAGYNMIIMPIFQGMSQMIGLYGEHDARTIEDMAAAQILYPPRSQKDANEYSEMLGYTTEKASSTGISRPRAWGGNNGSVSENVSDQRRALMLPQELRELPWTQEIIITAGIKPILCEKALYYADPVFMNRLKALSPTLNAIKGLPTEAELKAVALTKRELSVELPQINVNRHAAKVERRIRVVKPGEAIEVDDLTSDTSGLPRIEEGNEAHGAGQFVEAILERFDPDAHAQDDGLPRMSAMWEPALAPLHVPELDEQKPLSEGDRAALMAQMFGDEGPVSAAVPVPVDGFQAQMKQAREEREARGAGHGYLGVIDLGALAKEHVIEEAETSVANVR
jgi:type IV secretion system protein VirD4